METDGWVFNEEIACYTVKSSFGATVAMKAHLKCTSGVFVQYRSINISVTVAGELQSI